MRGGRARSKLAVMTHDWQIEQAGPAGAATTVLLLPGGMCSVVFMRPLMEALAAREVRAVAATLPGFGRTRPLPDPGIEAFATAAGVLAAAVGADVLAGHSIGANVALEAVVAGRFTGPVALLSPSLSLADEYAALRGLDRLGRVPGLGALVWRAALKAMPKAAAKTFPEDVRDALAADLADNDPVVCRGLMRGYVDYLRRQDDLAGRLCGAGVPAAVAFGDHEEVGLAAAERAALDACPHVTLTTLPGATHGLVVEQPERVAELIAALAPARV